ncbi:hypothetical protein NL386_37335, partial [Klebsiella pneumoniae]|nr:hypothetical protein [Klebsiella pneumoniae]
SDRPKERTVNYSPDSHYGTLDEPVILVPMDEQQPQKILEDGNLFILMPDGTRYSATGKKIESQPARTCIRLPSPSEPHILLWGSVVFTDEGT